MPIGQQPLVAGVRSAPRCLVRAGFRRPSEDGGLEELEESLPKRRSSSATLASSAAIAWAWTALTARNSAMIAAWTATMASRSTTSGEIVASE
jgi:hypothetical protein